MSKLQVQTDQEGRPTPSTVAAAVAEFIEMTFSLAKGGAK